MKRLGTRAIAKLTALFLVWLIVASCEKPTPATLFKSLPPALTGIPFENHLTESDSFNIVEYLYFYNGAGIAIGDINNDELADLYFVSNQGPNKLYLNKGEFKFEDITERAGVQGIGNWKTGVTMADVNGDTFVDIFVCGVGGYKGFNSRNQLLINNGDQTFTDQTDQYNLTFQGFSSHASFFDYDNDGDLDLYLLNHSVHSVRSYGDVSLRQQHDPMAGDRLYRNERIPTGNNTFTDVTLVAGIYNSQVGYGLAVSVSDLNRDGFMDIYVSNDFHENDYLYINQKDGTFKQQLEGSIAHTSRFSMGNDIGDINNDGWQDIVTLDMLPADEEVIKASAGEDPYEIFQFKLSFGYHYQLARNTLQLNRGVDSEGKLLFSDIAPLAGVEATDWSWSPLLADFDNDGNSDLFVSNGIMRRPNDLDYINFISSDSVQRFLSDDQIISKMPEGKLSNYFFQNEGDLRFTNATENWIGRFESLSNGAAYGDLDNDGDLDLVVNNINEPAFVYRNDLSGDSVNYLRVRLVGDASNTLGIGAKILAFYSGRKNYREVVSSRGWQSSSESVVHFGLGNATKIDSLVVIWPGGASQRVTDVKVNQLLTLNQRDASGLANASSNDSRAFLKKSNLLDYTHQEDSLVAFERERLIPHMLSTQGPAMAIGDINNDNLQDIFVGGAKGQSGSLFIQTKEGDFTKSDQPAFRSDDLAEDVDAAMTDVDKDGFLDLVVVGGGQQSEASNEWFVPRVYINNRRGKFNRNYDGVPKIYINASCVAPVDLDGDNDVDLFIGGRVVGGQYGITPASYLLLNDGKGNYAIANKLIPEALGMVSDATWTDLNGDNRPDLIAVGEWMPVTILIQNERGELIDHTEAFDAAGTNGWWNSIKKYDLDSDGDDDFLLGNLGLNSRLHPSRNEPVELWVGDIDGNGSNDPILTYFNQHRSTPFLSRDQLVRQIPSFKRKFLKYHDFKSIELGDLLTSQQQKQFVHKSAYNFASGWMENLGDRLAFHPFPVEAQFSPIFDMEVVDINGDSKEDIVLVGNLYEVQPELGRYDASYGLVMLGDGKGRFTSVVPSASGFSVEGQGRRIGAVAGAKSEYTIVVIRNNGPAITFQPQE